MTTATMTLTDFLLARIAEKEADLRSPLTDDWEVDVDKGLAECEATRRIVEFASGDVDAGFESWDAGVYARTVLGHLAAVYADHPDYRDDWRP